MKTPNGLLFSLVVFASLVAANAPAEESVTTTLTVDSPVLASRGDGIVTQADFDIYLAQIPEEDRAPFLSSPQRVGDILDRLLRARQIYRKAEAEEVWQEPVASASLYQGLVMAGADYYLNRIVWPNAKLPDYEQQARELFLTRPDLVRPPVEATFTGFFVAAEPVRGELDAMRSIINVYDMLREGSDFDELTGEYSEQDPYYSASGRVENVPLNRLEASFSEILSQLPPGEISQPFRTEGGWRIVQLHERGRPEAERFEDVADQAIRVAERRHHQAVRERIFRELSSMPVVFEDNAIADLLQRYGASFSNQSDYEAAVRPATESDD